MKDNRSYVVQLSEHSTADRRAYLARRPKVYTFKHQDAKAIYTVEWQDAKVWKTRLGAEKWIDAHREELKPHYASAVPLNGAILFDLVREYVLSHGGEKGSLYDFSIRTCIGFLEVSVVDDWIACRFDDVKAACAHFGADAGLNTYSGKWNWGCGERDEPRMLFQLWSAAVDRLLVPAREVGT